MRKDQTHVYTDMYTKIDYMYTQRTNEVNDTFEAMIYMQLNSIGV